MDDCGTRIHPQIVEGQVHGATAHAIGGATHEHFPYDEEGNLLTPNFYDYHVPHAMDMPPLKTDYVESPSPFTPLGAKGMGEGGGAGLSAVCSALQNALRGGRRARSSTTAATRTSACGRCSRDPAATRENVSVEAGEGRGHERSFAAPREVVWDVLNDPAQMAQTMPNVESFEVQDERHWKRERGRCRSGSAR